MNGSLKIGSLFGVPILLHWTFIIIIPLLAWIIGVQIQLTTELIQGFYGIAAIDTSLITSGWVPYILGAVVAIGLFVGVLIHEIAHSVVARRNGIKINNITLLIFGGVSSMEEGIPDPKVELPMALAGPLTSFFLGLISSGIMYGLTYVTIDPPLLGALIFVFGYLGLLNILLFGFNMIPAFPMDGGRVLRAGLARRMSMPEATRVAANVGKVFAVIFGIVGVVLLNPILIIIAFFIYLGAGQEASAARYSYLLRDVKVGDMMSSPVITVPPTMSVRDVLSDMYRSKHLGFPVVDAGRLVGIVTLEDVHKTKQIDRDAMLVKDIMTRQPIITIDPDAPVVDALQIMSIRNIGRIPVEKDGQLVGIVTRTDIVKVIELRELRG